ncbi:MAG: hemolysin family protein [Parachlamydiales bacterium]|nr:hemolysin family protein [Parachlamydiales bacterium]
MNHSYLLFTLLAVAIQGFFAFFEMACVSFNKVRLQYYVSIGTKRALWLNYLLKSPSRLFGTTLIGITTSLVIGSECARRFYESMNLNPDWAPLTQVPIVVIFGELAPMFAARRHPEQAAMFCVPVMIFLAKILSPIIMAFDAISKGIHKIMGKELETPLFLTREEVRMAFEEKEAGTDEFNAAVSRIFNLKNLIAGQLMIPISDVQMAPSQATLADVRHLLSVHYTPIIPIYHRYTHNIVGIVTLRDLLPLEEKKRVIDAARSPWFVTRDTSILQLLQQFKRNNQSTAVILEPTGQAAGILNLDQILAQIFGEESRASSQEEAGHYIQRTLSGEMSVSEFNTQFDSSLPEGEGDTLNDLILSHLDHLPVKGESVRIGDLEFTVEEPTLRGIKTLSVRSIHE